MNHSIKKSTLEFFQRVLEMSQAMLIRNSVYKLPGGAGPRVEIETGRTLVDITGTEMQVCIEPLMKIKVWSF